MVSEGAVAALAFGEVGAHALALALVVVVALALAPLLPHLELLQSCFGERPLPCVLELSLSGSWSLLGGLAVWCGHWGRKGPSLQRSLERLGAKNFRKNQIPAGDYG